MTATKQTKLLPCPFCGGEAKRLELEDSENFGGSVIACTVCDACSRVYFGEKVGLVESWNTRAQSAPEPVQGEAVEVVGYGCEGQIEVLKHVPLTGGMKVSGREREKYNVPLMTVAQHNRIMAAAKPDAELVALLRDAKAALDPFDDKLLEARIDAKLATLIP